MTWISIVASALLLNLAPAQTSKTEFVFGNENEPESLDPHVASGVPDNNIIAQMFEGLMVHDADWVSLKPGIAESIPSPTEGGKVYTFTLRKDAKWSDGSPITAQDFVWSWKRSMKPETLGTYSYWLTDNIKGAKAYVESPSEKTEKALGLEALDKRRLKVTLSKPVPYFLHLTSESPFFPVKKEVIEKHGSRWTRPEHIVSSGPYKMTEWSVGQRIVLKKNPHHWNAKNIDIEKIVALPLNNKQTAVNLFRQGKLDWTGMNGAPNALVPSFRRDPNFRTHPAFITYFYRINTTRPPLDDKRVRQALALAIDRKTLVEKITRGGELPADSLVPPETGDYRSPKSIISKDHKKNLAKARALMKEAGFPGGKGFRKLELQYDTKELHKRVAQAIQEMWRTGLGIEVEPVNKEWKVYLKQQKAMEFDISRSGWLGDYPDPASFLELMTSSSGNNQTGYTNPKYDKLFALSAKEVDPAKRRKLLQDAEALILEDLPVIPIYTYSSFGFLRPEVKGFEPNLVDRPFIRYFSKRAN